MRLLAARGGTVPGAPTMVLQHREALVWTLGKAAALEQLVMCQYLYTAFSMKDRDDEGLTAEQLEATRRWRREIIHIAEQEMLHLALVQNLLTAVGAGSAFERPNFPLPPHAYPAGIRMELLPFTEQSLRHFIYLERPEGFDIADQDALAAVEKAAPLPLATEDEISPRLQDFATIGELYRAIEIGAVPRAAGRPGDIAALLVPRTQARHRSRQCSRGDRHHRRAGRRRARRVAERPFRPARSRSRRVPRPARSRPGLRAITAGASGLRPRARGRPAHAAHQRVLHEPVG